ncbi:MAG TPA: di-heme oxidoredictase family protein [Blastocatellia bacterium]|nr:di-heme oxidoredictase family protein [Blastocatellia bacterium]
MRLLKMTTLLLFAAGLLLPFGLASTMQVEPPTEAPTGFNDRSNGLVSQEQFERDKEVFNKVKLVSDGLGPVYSSLNTCAGCHGSPSDMIAESAVLRAGHFDGYGFIEHPGGSLIQSAAIDPALQEHVLDGNEIKAFRLPLSLLGAGFVEAIGDDTLNAIASSQPGQSGGRIAGETVRVPVLEAGGALRVGRFGWKNQHASLLSFSADEYLNHIGITSPLMPAENTSNGLSVAAYDTVADPEDDGTDVETFTRFIRATTAPPRDEVLAATTDAQAGQSLFNQVNCNVCHVQSITTAPPGTLINGGRSAVPEALGNKIIHPFSDFLLHDVGTGDGIVQNGGPLTRNKMRTAPLWGLRTRTRLMHDGLSSSIDSAILRHGGEASQVINNYQRLSVVQKRQLRTFLKSL